MKLFLFPIAVLSFLVVGFACASPGKENSGTEQKADTAQAASVPDPGFTADCSRLRREAFKMDSILLGQTEIDVASANKAIKAFTDLAHYCPGDSVSPVYLVKTAQVAAAINNIPQAKLVLDKCVADYPNFKDRPAALFLLAQLYDEVTYLNNEQEAKNLYEKIILEYPKSPWAVSAKGAIGFIGKSDAQIMQELKKKNKRKD